MELLIAILVGVLFALSAYLLMGRDLRAVCMGIFVLGHGANLAILAGSGSPLNKLPPVLPDATAATTLPEQFVDPLPQALILTAIVIGFALQAFLLTLIVLTWRRTRTLDLPALNEEPADAA